MIPVTDRNSPQDTSQWGSWPDIIIWIVGFWAQSKAFHSWLPVVVMVDNPLVALHLALDGNQQIFSFIYFATVELKLCQN